MRSDQSQFYVTDLMIGYTAVSPLNVFIAGHILDVFRFSFSLKQLTHHSVIWKKNNRNIKLFAIDYYYETIHKMINEKAENFHSQISGNDFWEPPYATALDRFYQCIDVLYYLVFKKNSHFLS